MTHNIIEGFNLKLIRLTEDKIELVRRWRNDPKISQYMEFRDYITSDMQKKWFEKISKSDNNFFYIINVEGKDIGLINIKDVDFQEKIGEPGIFIWDDDFLNSDYSFRASLCLLDFAFYTLNLEKMVAHVLCDNKRAIQFNKIWGYKLSKNQEGIYNQEYTLSFNDYEISKQRILKYIK